MLRALLKMGEGKRRNTTCMPNTRRQNSLDDSVSITEEETLGEGPQETNPLLSEKNVTKQSRLLFFKIVVRYDSIYTFNCKFKRQRWEISVNLRPIWSKQSSRATQRNLDSKKIFKNQHITLKEKIIRKIRHPNSEQWVLKLERWFLFFWFLSPPVLILWFLNFSQ